MGDLTLAEKMQLGLATAEERARADQVVAGGKLAGVVVLGSLGLGGLALYGLATGRDRLLVAGTVGLVGGLIIFRRVVDAVIRGG